MTYLQAHPTSSVDFIPTPGIVVIDHYQHRQSKVKDGQVRWSVVDANSDLGDIWMSEGSYFSKFSDNAGNESLDDAIVEILLANGLVDEADFDTYPANDQEFVEFMTAATEAPSNVVVTPHEPKDQTEAIAIANGETWSDVGIYAEWAGFGKIERSHYRKLGTIKQKSNGKVEYVAIGNFRLCLSAKSVNDAIEQILQSFILTQSHRHAPAWHEYLGTQPAMYL
jgi:hypothetical protein